MTDAPIGFLVIFSFIVIIYVTLAIAVELLVFVTFVGSPSPIPDRRGLKFKKWVGHVTLTRTLYGQFTVADIPTYQIRSA